MKKITFLACIAYTTLLFTSCKTLVPGNIDPLAYNTFGTQTQVVLSQANFRIVKYVEGKVTVNTNDTKEKDAYASAYAELLYNARLQGSQALVNVSIEKSIRYSSKIGSLVTFTARGIVIEFLQDNGQPVASTKMASYTPSTTRESSASTPTTQKAKNAPTNTTAVVRQNVQPNTQEQYYILAYYYKDDNLNIDRASKDFNIKEIRRIARDSSKGYLSEKIQGLDTSSLSDYKRK